MGTRPEVIKMQSLYHSLKSDKLFDPVVCFTGQHMQLCEPLFEFFNIEVHHSLSVMEQSQTLSGIASKIFSSIPEVLQIEKPKMVMVQGDTTTALIVALSAFHEHIPVGHVEAGLRTGDLNAPFPEEGNRSLISRISKFHFAPTELAKSFLNQENIYENVYVTGNTVIDSLINTNKKVSNGHYKLDDYGLMADGFVLITIHRRESFGEPLRNICCALKKLADFYPEIRFVFPVHPNPKIRETINELLKGIENMKLLSPLPYPEFVFLMGRCRLLITDSGGVQEEAPALGKPIVVLRETTERNEVAKLKSVILAGANPTKIFDSVTHFLNSNKHIEPTFPFGDGTAANRIVDIIRNS